MSNDSKAIRLTRFFIRFAGFWIWNDQRGKRLLDLTLAYTIIAIIGAIYLTGTDLWYSRKDFSQASYAACNAMTILIITIKLASFTIQREAFISLIRFCYSNFWQRNYDSFGLSVMRECENRCVYFVCTFTFLSQYTVCSYTIHPIVENIGRNETDRVLLFNIWLDLPVTTTPYYEITFLLEELALIHSGICYFCFDNLFCIMIVHAAGQFRILQRRLELMYEPNGTSDRFDSSRGPSLKSHSDGSPMNATDPTSRRAEFKGWVRSHQTLIRFVEMIERVYTFVILSQVVVFSLLICLVSYQAVLANGSFSRRMIFIAHTAGTFTQLFMFTLSCDDLLHQSTTIADAAYNARWQCNISNPASRKLAKNLMFVVMRSRRPCCVTAGGFFPISLETFRTILSTSMSYLTLLRRGQESLSSQ